MLRHSPLLLVVAWAGLSSARVQANGDATAAVPGQALVEQALANELRAAQDSGHPMRYELRKASPRLTTTKEIFETRDGDVARLLKINDQPLGFVDTQNERQRLTELVNDPARQKRRKQAEDADAARALDVLRALPRAFVYQYAGPGESAAGRVEKFTFRPNPNFSPVELETQALTQMSGEMWIDPEQARVVHLAGRLNNDVDFGWGILGRLNKGGWIEIDQADVGGGVVRIVHFQMAMSGRVVFKTRVFDTTEDETAFAPLPVGMKYQDAIALMQQSGK